MPRCSQGDSQDALERRGVGSSGTTWCRELSRPKWRPKDWKFPGLGKAFLLMKEMPVSDVLWCTSTSTNNVFHIRVYIYIIYHISRYIHVYPRFWHKHRHHRRTIPFWFDVVNWWKPLILTEVLPRLFPVWLIVTDSRFLSSITF